MLECSTSGACSILFVLSIYKRREPGGSKRSSAVFGCDDTVKQAESYLNPKSPHAEFVMMVASWRVRFCQK